MPRPASPRGLPAISAPALLVHATLRAFLTPAAPFVLGVGLGGGGGGSRRRGPALPRKPTRPPAARLEPQPLRESLKIGPGQARRSASWAEAQGTHDCSHARGGFVGGHLAAPQH